ncbi:hypothetical protein FH972_005354 [Carpinus fangiana]|uniref:GH18 domain-containing protein n=1 Tax=Carpinus fangiana TaxID=176857 RepID=A0A5N6QRW9_9ROSI|nr:hypothetical protein FH972_005354 [Carpinus fangiana]
MAAHYMPALCSESYPMESMQRNLDWIHVTAYDYYVPGKENFTHFHAALRGQLNGANTDDGIKEWKRRGFLPSNLVLGLPFHGYAWTLVDPQNNAMGALSSAPAVTMDGSMGYKVIKSYIRSFGYGAASVSMLLMWSIPAQLGRLGLITTMWRPLELKFLMQSRMGYLVTLCFKSAMMTIGCSLQ